MAETGLIQDLTQLLLAKRQIILQGPPGTGKTRMAKRIAAAMLSIDPEEVEREERDNTCHLRTRASRKLRPILLERAAGVSSNFILVQL